MKWIELEKLTNIELGKTPARKNPEYWKGEHTWVSIADMTKKYISSSKEKISDLSLEETNIKIVPKGTVIMSFKLSIGKRAITEKKLYTNEAIAAFHIKDNDILNFEYLYYVLGFVDLIKDTDKAVMGKTLNKAKLRKIKIPVPPINIQKQIVEVLDEAQSLINNRKEQIKLLDDLIESVFYDMFGDPIVNSKNESQLTLDKICNLKAGKFIKASKISDLNKDNIYPCYGGNGLRGYVKEYSHNGSYPLIGRQGALCGNINFAEGKFYATEHAIVVSPIVELDISWLYTMLKEMNLNRLASGAAQPGLNVGDLKLINVIYPSIDKQVKFGDRSREIESQKQLLKDSLKLLEDNYNSLMQRAFKGQLF